MSYTLDGHNTVGTKTVANLDELRQIPTQGSGDVFPGQMIIVKDIDYSALVGADSGSVSNLGEDGGAESWVGPSQGYIELNPKHREHLYSTFPVEQQSLVDADASGTTFSLWFNASRAPTTAKHQTLFHIPTLSADDNTITNQYIPSMSVKGISLHFARHPFTHKPALMFTLSFTAPYRGDGVSGPLFESFTGWVEDEISLHDWHHVVLTINSELKKAEVWIDGQLRSVKELGVNVPDANSFPRIHVNGENSVEDHEIFIGASKSVDGEVGHYFGGYVDSFSYLKQYVNNIHISRMYADGVIRESNHAVGSFITPVIHWPMGDYASDLQAADLIIQNHWSDTGYPSVTAANCSSLLNLKSKSMESQYDVVRMLKDPQDISKGYIWCKSFAPSDDLKSRKSIALNTVGTSVDDFQFLRSDRFSTEYWDFTQEMDKGTVSLSFYPDSEGFTEPAAGASVTYSLLSFGYNHADPLSRQGIQIYVTKNSFLRDWSVVAIMVDHETGTETPFYGQGNLCFDSWNTVVLSWDFGVDDGEVAASLYLNKMTLSTKQKGSDIPSSATRLKINRDLNSRLQVGVSAYVESASSVIQLNPWFGRVDDLLISAHGNPSAHHENINITNGTQIMSDLLVHYTFGDHEGDDISSTVSEYSETNRVQNTIDPGIEGKIKNDLFRVFAGDPAGSRLVFEDGFSGSLIPVPRPVPSNWGTYYWAAGQEDWNTSYPDQIDYGFIHVKPTDVGEGEKGRWVSVVSYTAWTSYLFGESESVLFDAGFRSSVNEGDVAVFTESGKVVPETVIEQWVNPNLFPNNRPAPNSNGFKGQRCYDGYYMYECVALNTWIRYLTEAFW